MKDFKVTFIEGVSTFDAGMGISPERLEVLKQAVKDGFEAGESEDSLNLAKVLETATEVAETKGELVWLCVQIGGKFQSLRERHDPMAMLRNMMRG